MAPYTLCTTLAELGRPRRTPDIGFRFHISSGNCLSCLCFPQFCSTRAELVNNPHPHSRKSTVIDPRLSAWICQPFCCQRTFALIPSERLSIPLEHCLATSEKAAKQ